MSLQDIEQLKCLADIRHAIGDNGLRMQDELVEHIKSIFDENEHLKAKIVANPLKGIVKFNQNRNLSTFNAEKERHSIDLELIEFDDAVNEYEQVDALADVIVFSVGAIYKMGYDPEAVLRETAREINSREGEIDPVTGKWEKNRLQDPSTLYKAVYTRLNNEQ